ncbi:MAG: hypothetical protein JW776_15630 [Candidatus Lokiarchaeota archaeon]|nr:hypothetical protein [Candidatus Lokiarchaeota archaeon]
MIEEKSPKKLKGFARTIDGQLGILNESEYFKNKYGDLNLRILLINTDERYAALVSINDAIVDVDGIKFDRKDPNEIKKLIKSTAWNGMLKVDTEQFFAIATGKMSTGGLLKLVLKRNLRGIKPMLSFSKLFGVIGHEMKKRAKEETS